MVKGISKRVVVVKSPDVRLFEEAIFIVKEDAFKESGVSSDEIIQEAQRVADGYLKGSEKRSRFQLSLPSAAVGAGALGVVWLALLLAGLC